MQNIPDDFPDVIRIETAGKCNFKCIHCPTGTRPNNRPVLSKESFDFIVDQFTSNRFVPRVVVLYHGGEPLLNKKLSHFIDVLKKMGVNKTVITTNASLLTEERSRELIEAGLDEIKISFDGESADENNYIRQKGDFYRDAANARAFCRLRRILGRKNPRVIITNIRICDKNTLHFLNNSRQLPFQDVPAYITEYFFDERDEIEFRSFPAMVWPSYEQFGNLDAIYYDTAKPKYCGPLLETFTILSNGNVVLCCYDLKGELVLGNIYEESMFDIWNGEEYAEIRMNFRRQKYCTLCRKCNVVSPRYLCKM